MNEKTELQQWYEANPAPSMSMCATQADYWRAMYEYREAEAHQLSEEIIRLRAASTLFGLRRYLNDVLAEGTVNEQIVARTALRMIASPPSPLGDTPDQQEQSNG